MAKNEVDFVGSAALVRAEHDDVLAVVFESFGGESSIILQDFEVGATTFMVLVETDFVLHHKV